MCRYWQISAGNGSTDMVDIFIKVGIALIGPGNEGDYFDNRDNYKILKREGNLVRKFAEEVQIGDIFVLKHIKNIHHKTWEILAIGKVTGPYRYEPIFDKVDYDNWSVEHCRRVDWMFVPERDMNKPLIIKNGGAPIRIQELNIGNPMRGIAENIINCL